MLLGRVIGTVVPAMLVDELDSTPLLWVQPLDREGQRRGRTPRLCRRHAHGWPRSGDLLGREP